jgi:hypothetical protein
MFARSNDTVYYTIGAGVEFGLAAKDRLESRSHKGG